VATKGRAEKFSSCEGGDTVCWAEVVELAFWWSKKVKAGVAALPRTPLS